MRSTHLAGRAHGMCDLAAYTARINATNFALANDDGTGQDYSHADVILVGVSRSGKTPTCLYMALQYGVFAANYPLTEDDLEAGKLPARLEPHRASCTRSPSSRSDLQQIRNERRPESRYASRQQVTVRAAHGRGAVQRATRFPCSTPPSARSKRSPAASSTTPASSGGCDPERPRARRYIVTRLRAARGT